MNTNSNVYTVVYTTIVVMLVAAILAFVSTSLKDKQEANEKADTISQILTAAQFGSKKDLQAKGNSGVIELYKTEIAEAYTVNAEGVKVADLDIEAAEVFAPAKLKEQNRYIKNGEEFAIPVFVFKNGKTVLPVYGAGLWGPIWGYIALEDDLNTIAGAFFDHEGETPGLGAKIKDDLSFQESFKGESLDFAADKVFAIVKGGAPKDAEGNSLKDNKVDAISGATMTCNGLNEAINTWFAKYKAYLQSNDVETPQEVCEESEEEEVAAAETVEETVNE